MPQLQPGMARIRVKDLCLRTFIGINEDEILNKQDVLINLTILYAAQEAVRDNDIDHALNYRTITKAIIAHVEGNRFALLERLTQEILDLAFVGGGLVPLGQAVAAEAREVHQVDVLHVLAAVQVGDQPAKGGGFKFQALLIGHGGLCEAASSGKLQAARWVAMACSLTPEA